MFRLITSMHTRRESARRSRQLARALDLAPTPSQRHEILAMAKHHTVQSLH